MPAAASPDLTVLRNELTVGFTLLHKAVAEPLRELHKTHRSRLMTIAKKAEDAYKRRDIAVLEFEEMVSGAFGDGSAPLARRVNGMGAFFKLADSKGGIAASLTFRRLNDSTKHGLRDVFRRNEIEDPAANNQLLVALGLLSEEDAQAIVAAKEMLEVWGTDDDLN
jgi:hypothetical protein